MRTVCIGDELLVSTRNMQTQAKRRNCEILHVMAEIVREACYSESRSLTATMKMDTETNKETKKFSPDIDLIWCLIQRHFKV